MRRSSTLGVKIDSQYVFDKRKETFQVQIGISLPEVVKSVVLVSLPSNENNLRPYLMESASHWDKLRDFGGTATFYISS